MGTVPIFPRTVESSIKCTALPLAFLADLFPEPHGSKDADNEPDKPC